MSEQSDPKPDVVKDKPENLLEPVPNDIRALQPQPTAADPDPKAMFKVAAPVLWAIVGATAIYLGNFTMGVDLLPDNLPVIGNIDEVVAFVIGQQAWVALHYGKSRLFEKKTD